MLNNIKTKQRGFTIVELLIVIVVIAILAAITIVAYNGIQNRGKASASQSLANAIAKKAEAYNTIQSQYPTLAELVNNYDAGTTTVSTKTAEAKLDDSTTVVAYVAGSGAGGVEAPATYVSGTKNLVVYRLTAATGTTAGGCVYWWDYASSATNKSQGIKVGAGTC